MSNESFGPHNTYFCERHARIALERLVAGERNVEGHLRHVVYRLGKDLEFWKKTLGPKWREKLRRGKYK